MRVNDGWLAEYVIRTELWGVRQLIDSLKSASKSHKSGIYNNYILILNLYLSIELQISEYYNAT